MRRPLCVLMAAAWIGGSLLPGFAYGENYVSTMIRATFKIANPSSTATCFLVRSSPDAETGPPRLVLVSANHALERMTGGTCQLVLRKPFDNGSYARQELTVKIRDGERPLWTKHPSVDVAAMPLELPDGVSVEPISFDWLADEKAVRQGSLEAGDEVRILGYPAQIEANGAGFPVVRSGVVASYPLTPTIAHNLFQVDFNTFDGDSGGPVFVSQDTPDDDTSAKPHPLVVGLVIGQHLREERLKTVFEERLLRHRVGLGIAVQSDFIRQTIALLPPQ